ncbi:hypothetical protein [Sorangium cellulosum]|uniref:hypothetical protein n=1 Tax=Sorangium cellulosum TaxID=56 RepID=UPI0018F880BC|nr:hypothetical protein [Sorangium cellulosum]
MQIACLVLSGLAWIAPRGAAAQPAPHLEWAEDLVFNLAPDNNEYNSSPSLITWAGVSGARRYTNRTQCATFLTELLKRSYGFTTSSLYDWLGSTSPSAAVYHDAIVAEDGFERITSLTHARAGDILTILYPASESSTGHVAILRQAPRRRSAAMPLVPGTVQFEVSVVDSTSSLHGTSDSRMSSGGRWATGAGFGVMRLYTSVTGGSPIVGYTWSTATTTVYYPAALRPVAIGRLVMEDDPDERPRPRWRPGADDRDDARPRDEDR